MASPATIAAAIGTSTKKSPSSARDVASSPKPELVKKATVTATFTSATERAKSKPTRIQRRPRTTFAGDVNSAAEPSIRCGDLSFAFSLSRAKARSAPPWRGSLGHLGPAVIRSGSQGLHLMWSREKDPIDKLDLVYGYRIQPRLRTSQVPF